MAGRLHLLEKWINEVSLNPQIEAIVINDNSDDATSDELKRICQRLENIKLIEGNFGNPGSARNAGLDICQGKWVIFWDCDDEPNVQGSIDLVESNEKTSSDICFGAYKVFNENTGLVSNSPAWFSDRESNLNVVAQNPGIWRTIFAKELIEEIRFEPLKMAEDQIFISKALLSAREIAFSDTQIYTYFTGSLNHLTKNHSALQDLFPAFKRTMEILKASSPELSPLISLMAAKQFISGIKYGNLKTRYGLLQTFFTSRLFMTPRFLNAMRIAILNPMRGN